MGGILGGEGRRRWRQKRQQKQKRLIYSNIMQLKLPPDLLHPALPPSPAITLPVSDMHTAIQEKSFRSGKNKQKHPPIFVSLFFSKKRFPPPSNLCTRKTGPRRANQKGWGEIHKEQRRKKKTTKIYIEQKK